MISSVQRHTGRLHVRLCATSALSGAFASLIVFGFPAQAQDTGAACNIIGGVACDLSTPVVNGKDGPGADYHDDGHQGTIGNPGGDITADLESPRTLGSSGSTSPVNAVTIGGKGGNGSNSDPAGDILINLGGGWGQPGQVGGNINLTVGPALSGNTTYVNDGPLTSALTLISIGGAGGDGGIASFESGQNYNGRPGYGGNGGTITATIAGAWSSEAGVGLYVTSNGGQGGGGSSSSDAKESDKSPQGVDACGGNPNDTGCTAGNGGNITNVTINGTVAGNTYGAYITSVGGDGGTGGDSDSVADRTGGAGGNAGKGGNVSATLGSSGIAVGGSGAAFYVASLGGVGGVGGESNASGSGGVGGDAGTVTVVVNGNVNTSGVANTYGVLAQSLGGAGGNGGTSSAWFNPTSGSGSTGGQANTVTITGTGARITTQDNGDSGDNSSGLVAQSIGGGGGVGPDSNGWFAIGGNGGTASNGQQVSVAMTDTIVATLGFNSAAVVAQSIGGGGGKGGDATGSGYIVNMTIGGTGGAGGTAQDANVAMLGNSVITTVGGHSTGIEIQSIGGGGGDGGSAYGKVTSIFYGAAISVGGTGGAGGNAGTVNIARAENSTGQVLTSGSDSYGILGQSIGGGGGNGGASTAKSIVKGSSDYPSQSLALATGGSGGIAGDADSVYLQSSGLVATTGGGSVGIFAQAIGGGGGNAGDASASSSASGGNFNLAVSVAIGGTGGAAGNGGDAEATNYGLVMTTGESASGVMVQSIGGGGGNGGAGSAKSSASSGNNQGDDDDENKPEGKSLSFSVGNAGKGGAAGSGYNATATNFGAILTLGDSSHGVYAQSIGGGGGNGGGAAASTQGDITFDLSIGGSGGGGGDTYYTGHVNVNNLGTIVTYGADSNGILAQSIGGGGGSGGKAATSLSGSKSDAAGGNGSTSGKAGTLAAIAANYAATGTAAVHDYNTLAAAVQTINGVLGTSTLQASLGDDPGDLDNTAGAGGDDDDDNKAKSVSLSVGVGGQGGAGGAAGYITVTNELGATVATMGKASDAIIAQSIGGGGGKGGAASTATSNDISGAINVGGNGGGNSNQDANNGGQPTVKNLGTIYTVGALSSGIIAQSIGGGGGIGGSSSVTVADANGGGAKKKVAATVNLGGLSSKSNGISEAAQVTNSGAIETRGHDSYGIIAQSISGGGGMVKTIATDLDTNNSSGANGNGGNSSTSKDFNVDLKLGQDGQTISGNAGAVFVTTTAAGGIVTRGANGIGILAQVVAGGGGLALGGKPSGTSAATLLGTGGKLGQVNVGLSTNPDDNQGVHVDVGADIDTYGNGGVGVFAQSVGGSGGIAGNIGQTMQLSTMGKAANSSDYTGNGGDISVTVEAGATITTNGGNAPGIIAQTVGGGGGWITNSTIAYLGSAGGIGNGGEIGVNIQGTVDAVGAASAGIFAQSTGGADNGGSGTGHAVSVQIGSATNKTAAVWGGNGFGAIAAAVYIRNGVGSTVTNYGVVNTHDTTGGYAIYADGGTLDVTNYGAITGNTSISGNFINGAGGTYVPLTTVSLGGGALNNAGTIEIGGAGIIGTTTLTGNLVQASGGKLIVDADLVAGKSDVLKVIGKAIIDGAVQVRSSNISNRALTVLTASGGVTVQTSLTSNPTSQLYSFKPQASGNTLLIQPQAHFTAAATGLGRNQQAVASNLQSLFDTGANLDVGFNALAKVSGPAAYAKSLDTLSGQTLGALAAFRFNTSHSFVANMYDGCASFDRSGARSDESDCAWSRMIGSTTSQDGTRDALGYDATAVTFQFGAQRQIGAHWYLSGSLAYEASQFTGDAHGSKITGDSLLGGAYLRYHNGPLQVSAAVDAGYGWYQSRRFVAVGTVAATAYAKPEAWHVGVHGKVAYELPIGAKAYLKPFVDGHLVYVGGKAFAETGAAPFNLAVESQGNTALAGAAGAEIGARFKLSGGASIRPFASAAYEVLNNNDWATTARFVGQSSGPSFSARTLAPDRLGKFALGIDLLAARNADFSIAYTPEVGRDYTSHAGVARLSYRF